MKASDKIKNFIKGKEGLKLEAYRCPSNKWTIGYGHTGANVHAGMKIDRAEADRLFDIDLERFEQQLTDMVHANGVTGLTQERFDALLSFAYNAGINALRGSTLWRKVLANPNDPTIANEFKRWVYGTQNGQKVRLAGLERRRAEEAEIWRGKEAAGYEEMET